LISAPDDRAERRRDLAISALASGALNLLLWVLAIWYAGYRAQLTHLDERQQEYVVSSTAQVRIEHRTVPRPRAVSPQTHQPVAPRRAQVRRPKPQPTAASAPHEIARETQNAPQQPPPSARPREAQQSSLAQTLAQNEQSFAREAQRLHAQSNPLSAATMSPDAASAMRKSYFDISGRFEREGAQALLTPLKHWFDGNLSCYYVHYDAQFSGGGTEQGTIPWPVCYPRTADRMLPLDRTHDLPIPVPPAGYALPAGTYLSPLLRGIYERRPNPNG
jgi:hypothetical protein